MTEVFHIVPAGRAPLYFLVPVLMLILAVAAVVVLSAVGSRSATFELSDAGLRIRGDLYGRRIPVSALHADESRIVDLDQERTLRPASRRVGTALPGYRSGWFRLENGEKALVYVTDVRRVVYVPTAAGYSLLLTVDRPEDFVRRVRALAQLSP